MAIRIRLPLRTSTCHCCAVDPYTQVQVVLGEKSEVHKQQQYGLHERQVRGRKLFSHVLVVPHVAVITLIEAASV